MKLTNGRIILLLTAFLIGVVLVYLFDGKIVPPWADIYTEEYNETCWH